MRKTMFVALVVVMLALTGCIFGGGGGGLQLDPNGVPQVLIDMIVQYGGMADISSGKWHSPTAEPGMEQVHLATMLACQVAVVSTPQLKAFCETTPGAVLLLGVANAAACPVCKGALMGGGWSLIQVKPPTSGYIGAVYRAERQGVVIGPQVPPASGVPPPDVGAGAEPGSSAPSPL